MPHHLGLGNRPLRRNLYNPRNDQIHVIVSQRTLLAISLFLFSDHRKWRQSVLEHNRKEDFQKGHYLQHHYHMLILERGRKTGRASKMWGVSKLNHITGHKKQNKQENRKEKEHEPPVLKSAGSHALPFTSTSSLGSFICSWLVRTHLRSPLWTKSRWAPVRPGRDVTFTAERHLREKVTEVKDRSHFLRAVDISSPTLTVS